MRGKTALKEVEHRSFMVKIANALPTELPGRYYSLRQPFSYDT